MDRWRGKVAVVTGASAGIGAAISVALANVGVRVVGLARRPALVDKLQSEVRGEGYVRSRQCDVSKSSEVAATFQWIDDNIGPIHIIVNNAAVLPNGHITDVGDKTLTEEELLSVIDINVKGPILCTRHAVASMKRHGVDGHIVNINSIAGHYVPLLDSFNVYPCSKHAITAFTTSLNKELAHFDNKIKTTSVSPGAVATDMLGPQLAASMPVLQPRDVADAVLYALATPPNVNITELTITSVTEKWL